jgi:PIN domain nuclease of toxin-antitoxin system
VTLLLDTQALLWWVEGSRKLGPRARRAIEHDAAIVYVSAVSAWELAIKLAIGRVTLRTPLEDLLPDQLERDGFVMLGVSVRHAVGVRSLPPHHDDPFDRLLIAQAAYEGFTILTSDTAFEEYNVPLLDARA